jgi:hypothetical protein
MTYPYPGDDMDALLADIGATPAEAAHLREVLAEAEAEDPPPDDFGPWDDFHAATAQMDTFHQLDAQRLAEDVTDQLDRRPSAETILARALDRIGNGTYTEPEQFRADARDASGRYSAACGPLTDLGTCGARYHQAGCHAVAEGQQTRGSAQEAEAWNAGLLAHKVPDGTDLASPADPDPDPFGGPADMFSDLLAPPAADPAAVHARMLAALDDGGPPPEPGWEPIPPEQMPPVTGLRAALGL